MFLQPRESKHVTIPLDRFAFSFWDEILNAWIEEKGVYKVCVGKSSRDIVLSGSVEMKVTRKWKGI